MTGALKIPLTLAACVLSLAGHFAAAGLTTDSLAECGEWAARGDCDPGAKHSVFMFKNCPMSCFQKDVPKKEPKKKDLDGEEFSALSAKTANGKKLSMDNFDGYTTIIYTVARLCDGRDIKDFYKSMEHSHSIEPYHLELIAFPFNHVGGDFPKCRETNGSIEKEADRKLKIHVMEPININGPDAHPIFKQLKGVFNLDEIDPDFTHMFTIDSDGNSVEWKSEPNYYALMSYIEKRVVDVQEL